MNLRRPCFVGPVIGVCAAMVGIGAASAAGEQDAPRSPDTQGERIPVVFSGGHETDPRDRGRPVVLIAAALGVPSDVFREAFRHVRPAAAGERPDPDQVRRNKAALLAALSPYGVTNERLDAVSDHYRYARSRGEMWPTRPARAYAVVVDGAVRRYVIVDGGCGYSSAPRAIVPGLPGAAATARLSFSHDFDRNGAVSTLLVSPL